MAKTKKAPAKAPAKPKASKTARPTLRTLQEAIYPALEQAGKDVADKSNEVKQLVQDGASEVQEAVRNYAAGRISKQDMQAITASWAQATASATARSAAEVAQNTLAHLKNAAGAALKAIPGLFSRS